MRSRSGRRNRVEHVGGGDEQHLGQVERHVEVVVAERVVLFRDRAPRAAPRPGSPRKSAPSLSISSSMKTGLFDSARRRPWMICRAARRCRCAGGRGSRPRRACRPARPARTCARSPWRSIAPATSCRRPAGRRSRGSGPSRPASACGRRGTRGCGPWPSRGPSDRRRELLGAREVDDFLGALVPGQSDQPVEVGARHGVFGRGHGHPGEAVQFAKASFLTPSGMPAASIFSRSSSISLAWSSPSPSSFWMAFICSRRKYSRWFLPTSDCTWDWISSRVPVPRAP